MLRPAVLVFLLGSLAAYAQPETIITQPIEELIVSEGSQVTFMAQAIGAEGQVTFRWELYQQDVQEPIGEAMGPAVVATFLQPGVYAMFCWASDILGEDPTPAVRVVIVGGLPDAVILTPPTDETITVGESILLQGVDTSPTPAQLKWSVYPEDDPESAVQYLDAIAIHTFNEVGVFIVELIAFNELGADPTPDQRRITVIDDAEGLDTIIELPSGNPEITAGEVVLFQAAASNGEAEGFLWEITDTEGLYEPFYFDGRIITVDFSVAGTFLVSCYAYTEDGTFDTTPAMRTVTVSDTLRVQINRPTDALSVVTAGARVTFNASVTGGDGYDTIAWALIEQDADPTRIAYTGSTIAHTFQQPGYYRMFSAALLGDEQVTEPAFVDILVIGDVRTTITSPDDLFISARVGDVLDFTGKVYGGDDALGFWVVLDEDENPVGEPVQGTSFTTSFDASGLYLVGFTFPTAEDETQIDYRLVDVTGSDGHAVRIKTPTDRQSVAIGERFTLEAELIGIDASQTDLYWVVGDLIYSGATVENVSFDQSTELFMLLLSESDGFGGAYDIVFLDVFDPAAPLTSVITEPTTNLTVSPEDLVYFEGRAEGLRAAEMPSKRWWIENGAGTRIYEGQTLGRFDFPGPGIYTVSFRVDTATRRGNVATRRIRVVNTDTLAIDNNFELASAYQIEPGSYDSLDITQEEYYKLTLAESDRTLAIEVSGDNSATIRLLDTQGSELRRTRISATAGLTQSLLLQGLDAGTYVLHVIPEGDAAKAGLSMSFGVSVLAPSLFFAEVRASGKYLTDIGIVNPTGDTATVEMVGYDANGTIIESQTRQVPAMGKLAGPVSLYFTKAPQITWVAVSSNRAVRGYAHTRGTTGRESYAVTATKGLESRLFVPHIAKDTATWYTRASVINGSADPTQAVLSTRETEDVALATSKGFSRDGFDFDDKLAGVLPDWGAMLEGESKLAMAGIEVFGTLDGTFQTAGLTLEDAGQLNPNFTYVDENLYFTHIATDTETFWTGLALVNVNDYPSTVRMIGWADDGTMVGERTLEIEAGTKEVGPSTTMLAGIEPLENVAWVEVVSSDPIVGYELFGTWDTKRLAGFEASRALKTELVFPYLAPSTDWHGISVINVNDAAATLDFALYSNQGSVLATATVALGPRRKELTTLEALFDLESLPMTASWVRCTADRAIAGFQLFGNRSSDEQMAALIAD